MTLASRIQPILARLRQQALRLGTAWNNLSPRRKAAVAAACITLLYLLLLALPDSTACTTQADAEDRLADVMQDLHAQASGGMLSLDDLARRISEINAAATALTRSGDTQAYCDALETARARPQR